MGIAEEYTGLLPYTDESGGNAEEFSSYCERVHPLLPEFPEEVLRDWLYKHGKNARYLDGSLDVRALRFRREAWKTTRIILSQGPNHALSMSRPVPPL